MAAIEILGLEKTYTVGFWRKKPKYALRPLNLAVEEGEVFGFLGANGAGKTTTLKLLMGLIFPTGGSARILGMEIDDPRMKAQIGFLPEQPYFYDYLTARELLEYYGQLSGVDPKHRSRKVNEVLQRVGLPDVGGTQLRKFSKGMLQRVGIAQAILHDPKVVFLDEPMSGLDPMGRREVRDLMEQLKHEGKTVFFSTHILSDAEALCDRVGIIHQGELRGVGVVADLTSSVHGKVEVVWQGTTVPASLRALGAECHVTGDTVRAVLSEANQDTALEALRRERLRLISVTPVRTSLEDYFMQKLRPAEATVGARQGQSMSARIVHIASNTFREAVRDRVLYNLIVFAVLMSGASILVGQISIDIERLVVINLGLTAVSLFGMVIAIFIGIGLVSKEIEKRTLYTVLSRPVRRWEFIVGKFFGLAGTLVVNTFFMAIGVFAALLYVSHHFQKRDGWVLVALYFIILQFLIITALTLFFSSFSSPLLSAVFAFSSVRDWQLCRRPARIRRHQPGHYPLAGHRRGLSRAQFLRPERHQFSGPRPARVPGQLILYNSAYALIYATMAICGAVLVFEHRNLK